MNVIDEPQVCIDTLYRELSDCTYSKKLKCIAFLVPSQFRACVEYLVTHGFDYNAYDFAHNVYYFDVNGGTLVVALLSTQCTYEYLAQNGNNDVLIADYNMARQSTEDVQITYSVVPTAAQKQEQTPEISLEEFLGV